MRLSALLLVLAVCLSAQYTSLSTDSSGSTLFFTADFLQPGADQPNWGKLFIADDNGVRPFLIRPREVTPIRVFTDGHITNPYDLLGVDLASNNSRISVAAFHECTVTVQYCQFMDSSDVYDDRGGHLFSTDGLVSFSPNGAWALAVGVSAAGPQSRFTLLELATGRRYEPPSGLGNRYWRSHKVADNGTVAYIGSGRLYLFRPPGAVESVPVGSAWATIDAKGSVVVVETGDREGSYLMALNTAKISELNTLRVAGWGDYAPRVSDDGDRILFLSTPTGTDDPQIFTVRPDGTARRQVTVIPEGVVSAILSGNGEVSWAVTRTGRLLKIAVPTGAQEEMIGPVAAFYWPRHCSGSFGGSALSGGIGQVVSVEASVMPGETVDVRIGREPAIVTEVAVQKVSFRIPDALAPGAYGLAIRKSGDPRWLGAIRTIGVSDVPIPQESLTRCGPGESVLR